ncbi:MAG: hypothetical protein PHD10_01320 [Bacilli bacterium]|nr:hypothetical protein [Bacilli bacterium]MDD4607762.1 hypothetical protein [Bacilli bacterium]
MKKVKNLFKKLKELWGIPRYNALMKLGLWVIFFIFVSAYINGNSYQSKNPQSNNSDNKELAINNYKKMDNYRFSFKVTGISNKTITGKKYKERLIINYNDKTYYNEEDINYLIVEEKIDSIAELELPIDLNLLKPSDIYNLIKLGTLEEQINNVNNKSVGKKYLISNKRILMHYYDILSEDETSIELTAYEENNNINKVVIDFTNLNIGENLTDLKGAIITIEYSNINSVLPFKYNKDEIKG